MILYGISNCDTVKKARRWLEQNGVDFRFHDLRKDGLERSQLESWERELGWESLLNRRGTTWRKLPEEQKAGINDAQSAIDLMLAQPSIIKRPLLVIQGKTILGFSEESYSKLFKA